MSTQSNQFLARPMGLLIAGGIAQAGMIVWLTSTYGSKHGALWLVATLLGFTFFRSGYGFTRAWRNLVVGHSTLGVRAHLLWIALASALMFPLFQMGWGDARLFDIMRPVGQMMLTGAFLFGIGMQLAGSCTSGSMYRSGSGQVRLWFAVVGIITGAFFAARDYGDWSELPTFFVYSYQREFSWPISILIQLLILFCLWRFLCYLEKRWNGKVTGVFENTESRASMAGVGSSKDVKSNQLGGLKAFLFDRWSLGTGSIILAILSAIALILLSRPWVISLAFPLWATKATALFGFEFEFEFWDYWGIPQNEAMLSLGLFEDVTSLMNIAFILGATFATISLIKATVSAEKTQGFNFKSMVYLPIVTLIGGVIMGYGAVIGLGCNIGGFLAAVLSGSVHGWAWAIAALLGTAVGVFLRKILRL
jgi:uncharacterized membrane protein YedE/YeeE